MLLEPNAMKVARSVLRGKRGNNAFALPDLSWLTAEAIACLVVKFKVNFNHVDQ
ncbi:MAG: hypothetical protein Kow0049_00590 [Stanieria sp.]